jgi:hypothetical protein
MKFFKNLRIYLILGLLILIGIILISNRFVVYGLIVFGITALIYALWELIIKSKDEQISGLAVQLGKTNILISNLQAENNELRSRRLNIAEIKNILDLGLLQVNTSFTRTWNDKIEENNRTLHFIGALQVKIVARYGIDLKELRIRYNKGRNEVEVANINPKFLSFNDFDYDWKIAEIMEYKIPWFGSGQWRKSADLEGLVGRLKEELRVKTHQEVKRGPEELEWVLDPMKKQITGTIEILMGSPYRSVKIVDSFDDTFDILEEFNGFGGGNNEKELPSPV